MRFCNRGLYQNWLAEWFITFLGTRNKAWKIAPFFKYLTPRRCHRLGAMVQYCSSLCALELQPVVATHVVKVRVETNTHRQNEWKKYRPPKMKIEGMSKHRVITKMWSIRHFGSADWSRTLSMSELQMRFVWQCRVFSCYNMHWYELICTAVCT